VAALPEMLLPSANFAEPCVRHLINQEGAGNPCSSPKICSFTTAFAPTLVQKKQKCFYNTSVITAC
jgi:hypothetical protein